MHANKNFSEIYKALGRKYQRLLLQGIYIEPQRLSNWLRLKARIPVELQDALTQNAYLAMNSLLEDLGLDMEIKISMFQKGKTTVCEMRDLQKISQAELAKRTGLTQVTISNIESGKFKVGSLDTARRIAQYFNMPIEAFKDFN